MVTLAADPASDRAATRRRTFAVLNLLVRRDLKLRYAGAWLGYAWTMLEPLLMTMVYAFVFGVIISGVSRSAEQPYVLYLITGVLAWNWFNTAVNEGMTAVSSEAKIVRSADVPRWIWVLRTCTSTMMIFIFAIPVIAAFVLWYRHPVSWLIILFPLGIVLQFAFAFGIGLLLAPLAVLAGDVKRLVRVLLRVGFYLTPVLYSLNAVHERFGDYTFLAKLNPVAGAMSLYRAGLWAEDLFAWQYYVAEVVITLLTLALGFWVFKRLEGTVLKEL